MVLENVNEYVYLGHKIKIAKENHKQIARKHISSRIPLKKKLIKIGWRAVLKVGSAVPWGTSAQFWWDRDELTHIYLF